MLHSAWNQQMNERQRQLALAKLRREQQRIKREEKYDGAALLLSMADKDRQKKDAR